MRMMTSRKLLGLGEWSRSSIPVTLIRHADNAFFYRRATEEDVNFESDALDSLTQIGATCSLRYALNLIGPSSLAAARRKAIVVAVEDVRTAFGLFADTQRSLQFIEEQQDLMMFGQKQMSISGTNGAEPMMTD